MKIIEAIKLIKAQNRTKNRTYKFRMKNPIRSKEIDKKHTNKRKKELKSIPLNLKSHNCSPHHINNELVIYIPMNIHKKHWHDHNKPHTMITINNIAWNYLFGIPQQ